MRIAFALLALLVALHAQTPFHLVLPRECALMEGSANNAYPFSGNSMWSYQQIHDDMYGRPRLLLELAFRPDGGSANAACTMSLTLRLSTTAVLASQASTTFAANHGPDLTEVLTRTTVNWPAASGPSNPPVFPFPIPFPSAPFLHKGNGGLCWEVRVHSNSLGSTWAARDAHRPTYDEQAFGAGCLASGGSRPTGHTLSIRPDASFTVWEIQCGSSDLLATVPALWMLGTSDQGWGPVRLPFDLAPLGSPGCFLYTNIIQSVSGLTSSTGTFDTLVPVRFDPHVVGAILFSQVLIVDQAKPFPITTTNGFRNVIPGMGLPACRIYASGNDAALTGTITSAYGLVTRVAFL